LFNKGFTLFNKKEYQEAADTFTRCLEKEKKAKVTNSWNPEDIVNNIGICQELMEVAFENDEMNYLQHFKTAKSYFERALKLNASRLKVKKGRNCCSLYHLASCHKFVEGKDAEPKYQQSLKYLEEIERNESEGLYVTDELTLGSVGKQNLAKTVSRSIDVMIETRKMLGDIYAETSDFGKAIYSYGKLLDIVSGAFKQEVEQKIANCLRNSQGEQDSWTYLTKSSDCYSRGFAHFQLENYEEAKKDLRHIDKGRHKEDHPKTVYYYKANKLLTLCYFMTHDNSRALKVYDARSEKVEYDGHLNGILYWNIAVSNANDEQHEEANKYLDMSLSCYGNDRSDFTIQDYIVSADIKSSVEKNEEAIEFLNKALTLCTQKKHKKDQESIYRSLITIFTNTQKLNEAVKTCKELLKLKPSCSETKKEKKLLENQLKSKSSLSRKETPMKKKPTYQEEPPQSPTFILELERESDDDMDVVFYVCKSNGKLSNPFRYQHVIKSSTTFEDMRRNILDDLDAKQLNLEQFRISPRVLKPVFWSDETLVYDEIVRLKVNDKLKAREIYLFPKLKYQIN